MEGGGAGVRSNTQLQTRHTAAVLAFVAAIQGGSGGRGGLGVREDSGIGYGGLRRWLLASDEHAHGPCGGGLRGGGPGRWPRVGGCFIRFAC